MKIHTRTRTRTQERIIFLETKLLKNKSLTESIKKEKSNTRVEFQGHAEQLKLHLDNHVKMSKEREQRLELECKKMNNEKRLMEKKLLLTQNKLHYVLKGLGDSSTIDKMLLDDLILTTDDNININGVIISTDDDPNGDPNDPRADPFSTYTLYILITDY